MQRMTESHFADRLIGRLRQLGHPLCVGLDPHLDLIPPLFRRASMAPGDPETSKAVEHFLCTVVSRVAARVAVVKPQVAFFEALGAPGMAALNVVVGHARSLGLEVLLDAKRGDIGSTARAYGAAYLEPGAPCAVDAMTLNPYLGLDTLLPLLDTATAAGGGSLHLGEDEQSGLRGFSGPALSQR